MYINRVGGRSVVPSAPFIIELWQHYGHGCVTITPIHLWYYSVYFMNRLLLNWIRFQDLNTTWNGSKFNVSRCFSNTFLIFLPCTVVWLLLPLEVYWMTGRSRIKASHPQVFIARMVSILIGLLSNSLTGKSISRSCFACCLFWQY